MRTLVEAGLVSSRRGINGGFQLARNPAQLSLLEVVHAITPATRINACPSDINGQKMCGLHRRLGLCEDFVERTLKDSTVADVLGENETEHPNQCYGINVLVAGAAKA